MEFLIVFAIFALVMWGSTVSNRNRPYDKVRQNLQDLTNYAEVEHMKNLSRGPNDK